MMDAPTLTATIEHLTDTQERIRSEYGGGMARMPEPVRQWYEGRESHIRSLRLQRLALAARPRCAA